MKKFALYLISLTFLAQGCVTADTFSDPVSGIWAYYADGGFVYVDNSGERALTPEENRYYATSGTVDGVIFVAKCVQHDDTHCVATDLAMMNKSGELLNRFGEFEYPQLDVVPIYPAAVVYVALDGTRYKFPLWRSRSNFEAADTIKNVFVEDRLIVAQNGMYGFVDRNGNAVVTPRFLAAKNYVNGKATVVSDQGVGTVDPYGHYEKEAYACVLPYDENVQRVNVGGTLVNYRLDVRTREDIYVSKSLDLSVENHPKADQACQGGKWGLVNSDGKTVIPPLYDEIAPVEGTNHFWVQDREKDVVGFYDRDGNVVMAPEYPYVVFGESFFIVQNREGKFAIFDTKGQPVTEFVFDNYQSLSRSSQVGDYLLSEYAVVSKDGRWGVVAPDGRVTVPFEYELLGPESEGLIAFKRSKRWGVIDAQNKEMHSPIYGSVGTFVDGRAEATLADDTIYIYRDESARNAWIEKARLEKERTEQADREAAESARVRNETIAMERLEEQRRQTALLADSEIERIRKEIADLDGRIRQLQHQHANTGSRAMENDLQRLYAERAALQERIDQLQLMKQNH